MGTRHRADEGGRESCRRRRRRVREPTPRNRERERERGLYVIDDDEMCTVYGDGRGVVA